MEVYLEGTRVTMLGVAQFLKSLPQPTFPSETWIHIKEGSVSQEVMLFGGSGVTDADIACFHGLSTLRQVNLDQTQITDACLKCVASFKSLELLDIPGTRISGEGLEYLKGLTKLDTLDLCRTKVTDAGLERLKGLSQLQTLDLGSNHITDAGLEHLKALCGLHWLGLSGTDVTGDGREKAPAGIAELQHYVAAANAGRAARSGCADQPGG